MFLTGRMLDSALKQMMLCSKLAEIVPVASIKKMKMPKKITCKKRKNNTAG